MQPQYRYLTALHICGAYCSTLVVLKLQSIATTGCKYKDYIHWYQWLEWDAGFSVIAFQDLVQTKCWHVLSMFRTSSVMTKGTRIFLNESGYGFPHMELLATRGGTYHQHQQSTSVNCVSHFPDDQNKGGRWAFIGWVLRIWAMQSRI